ncbi:MAG: glutathione peroxidase [Acidobacteria bacterium]|nr:glutathione peroxidase [Acidobacteriota bacterium]
MSNLGTIALTTIEGGSATLADYAGRVLLIVNVASKCGLTPQYTALEALYQRYKDRGLTVLGFPANDFAGQEPGTDQEIAKFCSTEYPVTFPLFSKIAVTGPSKHPLYQKLIAAAPEHLVHGPWRENLEKYAAAHNFPPPNPLPELLWNFEKFLIGRDGSVLARFAPDTPPDDPVLLSAVEQALAA